MACLPEVLDARKFPGHFFSSAGPLLRLTALPYSTLQAENGVETLPGIVGEFDSLPLPLQQSPSFVEVGAGLSGDKRKFIPASRPAHPPSGKFPPSGVGGPVEGPAAGSGPGTRI